MRRWAAGVAASGCIGLAFVVLSASPEHYWDEYFYLFSVRSHSPATLVALESTLADGIVPSGFFSGKIGFVTLLWGLVSWLGDGIQALRWVRLAFAALVLAFGAATYKLLAWLLPRREAAESAVIAVFLPVSLYLGFKTLSESPALLFGTLGLWGLVASLEESPSRARRGRLLLAIAASSGALLCRAPIGLLFVGLLVGLSFGAAPGVPRRTLIRHGAAALVVPLVLVAIVFWMLGASPVARLTALAASVTERVWSPGLRLYAVALFGQLFWIPALVGCRRLAERPARWAVAWLGTAVVPVVGLAQYAEPRYFVAALIPFAVLVRQGLWTLASRVPTRPTIAFWSGFALLLIGNRLWLAPLMPFELDERAYGRLMTRLAERSPSASFLVPWISDYCYLAFAHPERRIVLVMSSTYGTGGVFETRDFLRWVGPDRYAGSPRALDELPRPWFYVGWRYNPTVARLEDRLARLGLAGLVPMEARRQLLDHLTPSWVWSAGAWQLVPFDSEGPYRAFEVRR